MSQCKQTSEWEMGLLLLPGKLWGLNCRCSRHCFASHRLGPRTWKCLEWVTWTFCTRSTLWSRLTGILLALNWEHLLPPVREIWMSILRERKYGHNITHFSLQVVDDDLAEAFVKFLAKLVQDHCVSIAIEFLEFETRVAIGMENLFNVSFERAPNSVRPFVIHVNLVTIFKLYNLEYNVSV